jgi:hypothetical protein
MLTMRSLAVLVVTVIAAGLPVAAGAREPNRIITATSIGGAPLGLTRSGYVRLLGRVSFTTRFAGGVTRLVFEQGSLHVYLASPKGRGIGILTQSADFKTQRGVGPCSSTSTLRRVYGARLRPYRVSRLGHLDPVAYRLGQLIFSVPGEKVGAVLLASRALPISTIVNVPPCGAGEED